MHEHEIVCYGLGYGDGHRWWKRTSCTRHCHPPNLHVIYFSRCPEHSSEPFHEGPPQNAELSY